MARKKSKYPTALELELLKVLWDRNPLSVREVREVLAAAGRELAHTSLITTLGVMEGKGFVKKRRGEGRSYLFSPIISRRAVSQGMLGDLVNRVFEGSASAMLVSLLEHEQLDRKEHLELRKVIAAYRKERNNER